MAKMVKVKGAIQNKYELTEAEKKKLEKELAKKKKNNKKAG